MRFGYVKCPIPLVVVRRAARGALWVTPPGRRVFATLPGRAQFAAWTAEAGDSVLALVLSQYVEASYAGDLLADGSGAVRYLLKDRVARVGEFPDAWAGTPAG